MQQLRRNGRSSVPTPRRQARLLPRLLPKPAVVVLGTSSLSNHIGAVDNSVDRFVVFHGAMKLGDSLPSFDGATEWLNGVPDLAILDMRPVLVHFWSTGCLLCRDARTDIARWRLRFAHRGLITIGVYQLRPEESFDAAAAKHYARDSMNIDHPCALDGTGEIAKCFDSRYPPGYYVFDAAHRLRHRQAGNDRIDVIDTLLVTLFKASPSE